MKFPAFIRRLFWGATPQPAQQETPAPAAAGPRDNYDGPVIELKNLAVSYGDVQALKPTNLKMYPGKIYAIVGPSGCGKSTLLKSINRMNETKGADTSGELHLNGENVYDRSVDLPILRKRAGMVFQKANPFPRSVYENVAYGVRLHGLANGKEEERAVVEDCLERADLLKDVEAGQITLDQSGVSISGGQQQRLCIARALGTSPEILLMDEPCSSLDPIATKTVEDLMVGLKEETPIVLITHNLAGPSHR